MKRLIFLTVFVLVLFINIGAVSADVDFLKLSDDLGNAVSTIGIVGTGTETISFDRYFSGTGFEFNAIYGASSMVGFYFDTDRFYVGIGIGSGTILISPNTWYHINLDFDWDAETCTLTVDNVAGSIVWTGFDTSPAPGYVFEFGGYGAIDNYFADGGFDDFDVYGVGTSVWTNGRIEDGSGAIPSETPYVPPAPPTFTSATDNDSGLTIKGGSTLQITTVASDSDSDTLIFRVCSTNSVTGSACSDTEYCNNIGLLTNPSCSFATQTDDTSHTWYAFLFDSGDLPATTNPRTGTYTTDSTPPNSFSITSVEGDISAPYTDLSGDTNTIISFSVTGAISCRWATTDLGYTAMSNSCESTSSCTFTGINLEQSYTHHISCIDAATNENNNTNNQDITWTNIFPFTITIESPVNSTYNNDSIWFNATVNKDSDWCGYSLDGAVNVTMLNNSGNWNSNNASMTEGNHSVIFSCNDTLGNMTSTDYIYFIIDTIKPTISFISPTEDNNSYIKNNYTYINWSIIDANINTTILNWNGSNMTLTNTSVNFTDLIDGTYTYYLWVNDTAGNSNQTEIRTITIDTTSPEVSDIISTSITSSSATISLNSNLSSTNLTIFYGTDLNTTQNVSNSTFAVNHSFILTGLSSSTLYYYNVSFCDPSGNCNTSAQYNFTTLVGLYCGDSTCNNGETCSTCANDCGSCTSTGGSHSYIYPTVTTDADGSNDTLMIDNTTINPTPVESNQTVTDNTSSEAEQSIIINETEALKSIETVESKLLEIENNGHTLNEEVNKILTLARQAFGAGNYTIAYNLAKDAETILNDEQQTIITQPETKQTISYQIIFAALSIILLSILYLKKTELLTHKNSTSKAKNHSANLHRPHSSGGAFFSHDPFNTKSNAVGSQRIYTQRYINTRLKQIMHLGKDYKDMHKALDTRLKTLKKLHSTKK
ncbi:MAG: hypothetical protein KAI18_01560 [Candidatus Aenigmarchaeota archaeon]|nr:hypothetical protein [Candidatus Aenigmarchaeota archaeon]